MVPWHLQPKYSPAEKGAGHKDEVTAAEEKAARARAKKLEKKKRRKAKEKGCAVTAGGPLPGEEKDVGPLPGEEKEVGPLPGEEKEANPIASCDAGGESRQQDVDSCEPVGKQDPSKAKTCDDKTYLVQQGYTTYHRYYHVFREGELTGLFHQLPQLHVQEDFYDHENWCVLAQKQF